MLESQAATAKWQACPFRKLKRLVINGFQKKICIPQQLEN